MEQQTKQKKIDKENTNKKIDTKEFLWVIVRIFIIFIFVFLSILGMAYHENWADEAQAWLLARDASFSEIIFQYARSEGSPVLWHCILKIAIMLRTTICWYRYYTNYSNYDRINHF